MNIMNMNSKYTKTLSNTVKCVYNGYKYGVIVCVYTQCKFKFKDGIPEKHEISNYVYLHNFCVQEDKGLKC